jgi:hypothetical protein
MNGRVKGLLVGVTATGGAGLLLRKALSGGRPGSGHSDPRRWRVVTVHQGIDEIGDLLPRPLVELGDAVEVRLTPAPSDKGTEIAVRLRDADAADNPSLEDLRLALRKSKQLLEVGWVLEPDRNSTTEPTPFNAPLRKATAHARGEGRL